MSRNLIYAHYVITPKKRQSVISPERERELFAYIMGISQNLNCKLIRINVAYNHKHILVKLTTSISFADYIAHVKRASSIMIREQFLFPGFCGWSREYSVQTVSPDDVEHVKQYLANQKEHHKVVKFEEEWLSNLPIEERASWDWRFFEQ